MKKLISCLLILMMLFTAASTGAFAATLGNAEVENAVRAFLDETDLKTQDLVLQSQAGGETTDLLIQVDGETVHLVSRDNGAVESHVQVNPTGIYMSSPSSDAVTLLRYATVTTAMQDITNSVNSMLEQAAQSIPEEQLPSQAEVQQAINQTAILAKAAEAQEQADAVTLNSAAIAFASKFKPEYILDVKEEYGVTEVSLRSEAYAAALAEAVDEMMLNPALADVVDRQAALTGSKTFAEAQQEWLVNRDATLEAIRSIESTETYEENGHYTSHYQIGEELSAVKILVCDTDAWINEESSEVEGTVALGFKNEDPLVVYEFAVSPDYYWEKQTVGESGSEVYYDIEDNRVVSGKVLTVVDGKEEQRVEFGPDYVYTWGPKGGMSTSVRETWTGITRYELVMETAEGEEAKIFFDFYQDDDNLVCALYADKSDEAAVYKISRVDKAALDDLSASKNVTEVTVDKINAEMENLLKMAAPKKMAAAQAGK